MRAILLIDFGSTFTKLTAVDLDTPRVLGGAQAFTTAGSDISIGLAKALERLDQSTGPLEFDARLACSSAAGGLNMVASGLVPGLTSKAARMAAFGAGAKVIKTYAYKLTEDDILEINRVQPDILLLCGGIDGGNSEVILHNAARVAGAAGDFPVLVAGNRNAQEECAALLADSGHPVYTAPNVMPEMNTLNIEPAAEVIRQIFLKRIILAKGLNRAERLLDGIMMPTPAAVLKAMRLLSQGTKKTAGLGDLIGVDLGGATTDIYSISRGEPSNPAAILRGLPEPLAKRTVEGDLGMRYNARGILDAVGAEALAGMSGLTEEEILRYVVRCAEDPSLLPGNELETRADLALAAAAVATALARHAGTLERVYTPMGPMYEQRGKDLTQVKQVLVTGGALVYSALLETIMGLALSRQDTMTLTPREARLMVDRHYILSAMGLLSDWEPEAALNLMKDIFGREEAYAAV